VTRIDEIKQELAKLDEEARQDDVKNENRDFNAEAREAHDDPQRGPQVASEIRAEGTLYRGRVRRRAERRETLETELTGLVRLDVSGRLETLREKHADAFQRAETALGEIDFAALERFEEQLDAFLAATWACRSAAVEAADTAKAGQCPAPGLNAVRSTRVEGLYDHLQRLAARVATPGIQARRDLTALNVERETLD